MDPPTLYYEINLNQNFRSKYKNYSHHTISKGNIHIVFPNDERKRVNGLGWLGPSQLARFLFKKRDDSTLKHS